jgi:hypothetical protein
MQRFTKEEILDLIQLINKTFGRYDDMSGGCYKFHLILNKLFNGMGYYDGEHVITLVNGTFYDIDGEYKKFNTRFRIVGGDVYPYDFMNKIFKEYL